MSSSDDDLVRRLESVPLADPPPMREAVVGSIDVAAGVHARRARGTRTPKRFVLALAWAAAVVIVIGIAFQRASGPRPQHSAATMATAPAELTVHRTGERFAVQSSVKGEIDWDQAKLSKVKVLPDGTLILERRKGASGTAFIRLSVGGREVLKTAITVDSSTF